MKTSNQLLHNVEIALSDMAKEVQDLKVIVAKLERRLTAIEPLVYEGQVF